MSLDKVEAGGNAIASGNGSGPRGWNETTPDRSPQESPVITARPRPRPLPRPSGRVRAQANIDVDVKPLVPSSPDTTPRASNPRPPPPTSSLSSLPSGDTSDSSRRNLSSNGSDLTPLPSPQHISSPSKRKYGEQEISASHRTPDSARKKPRILLRLNPPKKTERNLVQNGSAAMGSAGGYDTDGSAVPSSDPGELLPPLFGFPWSKRPTQSISLLSIEGEQKQEEVEPVS